ncbi:MAG TPA: DUF3160 domain-containing protein, partial [Kofleriaceae bacterium]|nr:DUF3160 domain-containing protein [Kofleriaceae bacterium]
MRDVDLVGGLAIMLVACGGAPLADPWAAPAAPRAVAPVAHQAPAPTSVPDPEPTWEAHACKKHVWSGDWAEDEPAQSGEFAGGENDRGHTLEDKLAAMSKRPSDGVCDVRLRDRLETGILTGSGAGKAILAKAWDHATPPDYLDLVQGALSLTTDEQARLARDGFVVPARLGYDDYTSAYSDIHRGQLPVFVTADSILHAIYISHDQLVAKLEHELLITRLDHALGAMHCALALAAASYPPDVADDLDEYLAVARSLLAGDTVP